MNGAKITLNGYAKELNRINEQHQQEVSNLKRILA